MNIKTGFGLSCDKTGKDRGKANYANACIGFGVAHRRSLTGIYLEDAKRAGIPVNEAIHADETTVAFVSVASERTFVEQIVALARKVIQAGGAVIMDKSGTGFEQSHSSFNRNGEGRVQDALGVPVGQTGEGYNVFGNLEVAKKQGKSTFLFSVKMG